MKKNLMIVPLLGLALVMAGCGKGGGEAAKPVAKAEVPSALVAVFTPVPTDPRAAEDRKDRRPCRVRGQGHGFERALRR